MGHMKGLSMALKIAVIAIVLLIIAIVLLTIFSNVLSPVVGLAEATNNCKAQGESTCRSAGTLPFTWNIPTMKTDAQALKTCSELWGGCTACPGSSDGNPCSF
ncbi:MAG: hypothetical protein ABIH52_02435 [Candidatus Aenigmatarchaeota archaeon]